MLKNYILFINENLSGIVFLLLLFGLVFRWFHNYETKRKYGREYDDNDKKFKTARCIEDGDTKGRNHIYLLNDKSNPKTYQRIADPYTFNELGYGSASREDKTCFSKNEYQIKDRIKIYSIKSDIGIIKDIKQ